MKKYGKALTAALVLCAVTAGAVYAAMAGTSAVFEDFEEGFYSWTNLYKNRAVQTVKEEENGNHYLEIAYNDSETDTAPNKYYDLYPFKESVGSGVIQADFDISFPETDTARNGQIQFKNRKGPGSADTTIVSRLVKNYYYLEYGSENSWHYLDKPSGGHLTIEPNHWYSVKMIVNMTDKWQSIYIFDRDTEKLLGLLEQAPFNVDSDWINMVTFSGSTTMNLDNVSIGETSCESAAIYGEPYLRKPLSGTNSYKYIVLGLTYDHKFTTHESAPSWSVSPSDCGVTIDAVTGELSVTDLAQIRKYIITAEYENGDTYKFITDVAD